ncbi:MAG: hypothetical protein DMG13_20660 [Acidobacteria bacterium]|nr:MAG: hypothetical protein DMG13_20660 [Acidobacteriota bacterium]
MRSSFVIFAVVLVTVPLSAHHGRGASYDNSKIETIQGTVSEWAWRNPHCALYVDVKGPDGKVVTWGFESQSVGSLSKLGMNRRSFQSGQQLTIKFNPSRGGAPVGVLRKAYDANGKEVLSFGGPIDQ